MSIPPADTQKLIKRLGAQTPPQLDAMVALMTEESYEQAWFDADHQAGNGSLFPADLDEVVTALAAATGEHEICSFVADDLTLLHRAAVAGLEDDPFIAALAAAYAKGLCGADVTL